MIDDTLYTVHAFVSFIFTILSHLPIRFYDAYNANTFFNPFSPVDGPLFILAACVTPGNRMQ